MRPTSTDWSSSKLLVGWTFFGFLTMIVSGVLADSLLPEKGPLVIVKGIMPAAVGGAIGALMIRRLKSSMPEVLEGQ